MKNLEILGRDMSQVTIIDNSVEAIGLQLENGVLIDDYLGDADDQCLLEMIQLLSFLSEAEDARDGVAQFYNST